MSRAGNGSRAPLTDEQVAHIIALFNKGESNRTISGTVGCTEAVIKETLRRHKVMKTKKAGPPTTATLTAAQEEQLVRYLIKQSATFTGNFQDLRAMVEKWGYDHRWTCSFTYAYRRAFLKRNGKRIPENIKRLYNTRPRQEYGPPPAIPLEEGQEMQQVMEEEVVDEEPVEEDGTVEWRIVTTEEQPEAQLVLEEPAPLMPEIHLTEEEKAELNQALQVAFEAFSRAGVPDARVKILLRNLEVPGYAVPGEPKPRRPKKPKKKLVESEQWRLKSHGYDEPSRGGMIPPRPPTKKSPLQLRVLEREFLKNNHPTQKESEALAKKLRLPIDSVLSWFRNRRQKRPIKK